MSRAQKERYYSDEKVVRDYDHVRFRRGGGQFVAEREETVIRELIALMELPPGAKALDCPVGTGRLLPVLQQCGLEPSAADISQTMLDAAARYAPVQSIRASADALPLEDASVQLWLMSRFAFHFADLRPFFREAARVLAPGGWLLFDIYRWTPRSWIPGEQRWLGGRTHTHPRALVVGWLEECGFEVVHERPAFLLAPYLYGWMPAFLPRWLERASDRIAPRWKTKSYLAARRR